jgi:hypothetical protein
MTDAEELELLELEQEAKRTSPRKTVEEYLAEQHPSYKNDKLSSEQQLKRGIATGMGRVGSTIGSLLPASVAKYFPTKQEQQSRENYIAGSGWGSVGDFAGELGATAVPAGTAGKIAGIGTSGLIKALGGGEKVAGALSIPASGAAGGAANEYLAGRDPVSGALAGTVLPIALAGAGKAGRAAAGKLRSTFEDPTMRVSRDLAKTFTDRQQYAVDRLRGLNPDILGEVITSGKAADSLIPELKAMQETATHSPGGHYFGAADDTNQALRMNTVDFHAVPGERLPQAGPGNPTSWSPLEKARRAATDPLYDAAKKDVVMFNPAIRETLASAKIAPMETRAARVAAQEASNAKAAGYTPRMGRARQGNTDLAATIENLQLTKKEMTAKINRLENLKLPSNVEQTELQQLVTARNNLNNEMVKQSEKYGIANAEYAKHMALQDQADAAKRLTESLRTPRYTETRGKFLATMNDTRNPVASVASPSQMADYNNVSNSLLRDERYANLKASPGLLPKYLSPAEELERKIPNWFSPAVTTTKKLLRAVGAHSDEEARNILNTAMRDPKKLADLMDQVKYLEQLRTPRSQFATGVTGAASASSPYFVQKQVIGE